LQQENLERQFFVATAEKTAKETCHFLGSSAKPPSKHAIFLAAGLNRQVNVPFPWLFD